MLVMPAPPSFVLSQLGTLRLKRRMWSQEDLAKAAGVGRATIARLEAGKPARVGTVRRLAEALGVSPDELMGQA